MDNTKVVIIIEESKKNICVIETAFAILSKILYFCDDSMVNIGGTAITVIVVVAQATT